MNNCQDSRTRQLTMLVAALLNVLLGLAERRFSLPEISLVRWHPSTGLGLALLLLGGLG